MRRDSPRSAGFHLLSPILVSLGPLTAQHAAPGALQDADLPQHEAIVAFVDSRARELIEKDGVPGLSLAIGRGGELLIAKGYGYADRKRALPATEDTIYAIGSLTREFTAVGILQLVEAEKLTLDDEISKLLPEFPTQGRKVTVRQLLANTAGIPGYAKLVARKAAAKTAPANGTAQPDWRKELRPAEFYELFKDAPFDFEPGQGFSLDNSGYVLLSMILAKVSGEEYAAYIESKMLAPLGMEHTSFCLDDSRPRGYAEGCTTLSDDFELEMPTAAELPYATQSLCSTVKDLFLWQRALVDRMLIGERSYRQMVTAAKLPDGNSSNYGFATSMSWLGDLKVYAHTGGLGGFRVRLAYYSHPDVTIAVVANCAAARVEELERTIARFLFQLTPAPVLDLPLEPKDVLRYAGTYQIATTQIRIVERSGKLFFDHPTQPGFLMLYQGEHVFVSTDDPDVRVTFDGEGERAMSFKILRGGFLSTAKRLE